MIQGRSNISAAIRSKRSKVWKNYYTLYMHYAYGTPMPYYFPVAILNEFPDHSYKEELKEAIASLQGVSSYNELSQTNELIRD